MATWNLVGNSTGEMIVTMEGEVWKEALAKAKERLVMRSEQVGTDPKLIEKAEISNLAVNLNLQTLYENGIKELNLEPVSEPVVNLRKLSVEGVEISMTFAVMPEIVVPDLSAIKYHVDNVSVTMEEIDNEIAEIKKSIEAQGQSVPSDEDKFAKSLGLDGVDSMDALKGAVSDKLVQYRKAEAERDAEDRLIDELCAAAAFEAPDGMVDMEIDSMIAADKDKVASMNGEWEEFLKSARKTEEDLRDEYRPEASRSIKIRLLLDKIAKENGLAPTAEEVEAEYAAMASSYGVPVEDFKAAISQDDIIYQKSLVKAMDFVKKFSEN